ncbi:MAG: diacylglycerol kinase family protein [Myxococcota bacterium]
MLSTDDDEPRGCRVAAHQKERRLVGLVVNPRAGSHRRDPELASRLRQQLGADGLVRTPETLSDLAGVAEEFRAREVAVVAIAGGDGTNHVAITHLIRAYLDTPLPSVALMRNGTMNTVANSLGIPRQSPERLLARYLRRLRRRVSIPLRYVETSVLQVGDHYGFIFGTGAIYGFIAEYNQRNPRGAAWAAEVLTRTIGSALVGGARVQRVAQRWRGRVSFPDGAAFPERDYFTVGASTCRQIGLGFKPFYRSAETRDQFHLLGIHCSVPAFIRSLPDVWRGRSIGGDKTYERLTAEATLVGTDEAPIPYTLDGDVYTHDGPLTVKSGPRLRILMP